jgi:transposase
MAIELTDTRALSDEVLEAFRLRALAAHEAGFSETTIAVILGVRQETVSRWWTAYQRDGLDGLPHERTGRPVGSGRWLSAEQEQQLQKHLLEHAPEAEGIPAVLWTRKAVRALVEKEFGLRLPIRTIGLYLQRWGWTPQRPTRKAYRQDPDEVRHWLKVEYPKIKARAKAEGAEIHWGDETGVEADDQRGRGYAPPGRTPERKVTGQHVRINLMSTITNQGAVRFMLYEGKMTAVLFILFLTRLVGGAKRKIFLIVDRLPAHVAGSVERWVGDHLEQIEIFYLPRYAPERNPDELLNNDVKGNVNEEELVTNQPDLKSKVKGFARKLAKLPERVMSYFENPKVAYAADG